MTAEGNRDAEESLSAGYAKCWCMSFELLLPRLGRLLELAFEPDGHQRVRCWVDAER